MANITPAPVPAHRRPWRIVAGIALLAVLLPAGILSLAHGEPQPAPEYAVKAAFLFNFAKFVEWPDDAFADPASPLVLCVLGEDPFGDALRSLKGKTVNGRPLAIRNLATLEGLERCHLLFVCPSEKPVLPKILQAAKGRSILTVGDMEGFAQDGGIINLVVKEENRVSIEINLEAAQRTRLKISSKLLALAKIVKPRRRQGE
jgi:hypothetical protein